MADKTCIFPKVKECSEDNCPIMKGVAKGIPYLFKGINIADIGVTTNCTPEMVNISVQLYLTDEKDEKPERIVSPNVECIFPDRPCSREACPLWFELDDFAGCSFHLAGMGVEQVRDLVKEKALKVGGLWEELKKLGDGEDRYTEKPDEKDKK